MASNDIRTYTLEFGKVYNNGVECKTPVVTIAGSSNIALNCLDKEACIYTVQVGPDVTEPCFTVLIQCAECDGCGVQEKTYCFCDTIDDCQSCESCASSGFCEQLCDPDHCDAGTCVDCDDTDFRCPCNLVCQNGGCECPAGLTYNAETGCCDECNVDGDCEDCELCQTIDGHKTCVPKECLTGVCNPDTNECVECNASGDCTGEHECCTVDHTCECCPGYHRVDGVCVIRCQFDTDCDVCEICDPNVGCIPLDCGNNVCNPLTNSCEEPCDGNCPPGMGCLNGFCVNCSTLSCSGVVSQCSQAQGCDCNGSVCEYVNCNTSDCVDWVITDPVVVPGTPVTGSGSPAPSFTVTFTQLGIVPMSGGSGSFLDYQITIVESGGFSGAWSVEGSALGSGSSTTFKLSDNTNVQWNNVGFEVNFVGNLGQTGSIAIYNTNWFGIDDYVADLFTTPANWVYDVQGTAVAPTYNGGSFTPGSLKLCACGEDSSIIGYSWTTTEGNLTLTFTPLPDGCVRATAQGCGTGEGTVTIDCAGIQTTLPLPALPYDLSGANCCDPLLDPDCNATPGDGFGCTEFTVVNGDLAVSNTNFITGDGYGLFRGVFQPSSIGYTVPQWIRVARTVCWSVTGTVREATSFIPPSIAHLFHDVEYRNGVGCLQLGKTCDIKISGCRKVEAEACFEGCEEFDVTILDNNPTFNAVVSLGNSVQVSYAWSTNTGSTGTGSSFVIASPNATITTITVVATLNVNGVICVASDTINIELDEILGCTQEQACNFDENATVNDGSCVILLAAPSYDCTYGFVPSPAPIMEDVPTITYKITGGVYGVTKTPLTAGQSIRPFNNYTVYVYIDGIISDCLYTLNVPTCYNCSGDDCIPANILNNKGYATDDCDESCGCSITITPYFVRADSGSLAQIYVNATGASGLQLVSIIGPSLSPVLFGNGNFSGGNPAISVGVCDGNYTITVSDNNCIQTANIGITGYDCSAGDFAFTADTRCIGLGLGDGPCYDTITNQIFYTFVGDACASSYIRKLWNAGETITYGPTTTSGVVGQGTIPVGIPLADGVYHVELTDNNVPPCQIEAFITVGADNCDFDVENPVNLTFEIIGDQIFFLSTFYLVDGGGSYHVQLIELEGGNPFSCIGATEGTAQPIINQGGVSGPNVTTHPNIDAPVDITCYKVVVTNVLNPECTEFGVVSVDPLNLAAPCSGSITSPLSDVNMVYNEVTEMLYVAWNFNGTSKDMTVKIYVSTSDVCDIDVDDLVVDISGQGESGDGWFGPIPQINGQDQCVTVIVHDTDDESCSDTTSTTIVACECEIVITSADVDAESESVIINYTTKCTSGQVDFEITGDGDDETFSDNATSTDGQWLEGTQGPIVIGNYPTTGGTIDIEATDNVDGACTYTLENVELPSNCVTCSQVVPWRAGEDIPDSSIQSTLDVRTQGNTDIYTGGPTLRTATTTIRNTIISGIIGQGGNFCDSLAAARVQVAGSGISVNQDDSNYVALDHVKVTSTDWVGSMKWYFTDCGCLGRSCDYTLDVVLDATTQSIFLQYGTFAADGGFSNQAGITTGNGSFSYPPTEEQLQDLETGLEVELNANENGCQLETTSVTVEYDGETSTLTITVTGTNVGLSPIFITTGTSVADEVLDQVVEFTQSGCA